MLSPPADIFVNLSICSSRKLRRCRQFGLMAGNKICAPHPLPCNRPRSNGALSTSPQKTCYTWTNFQRASLFQVRATEDVAAHAALPRRGEERPRPGGRTRQEGASVQAPGKIMIVIVTMMMMMMLFSIFWIVVDSCTVIAYFVKHSHQKH